MAQAASLERLINYKGLTGDWTAEDHELITADHGWHVLTSLEYSKESGIRIKKAQQCCIYPSLVLQSGPKVARASIISH
jgi:hypothetical protein